MAFLCRSYGTALAHSPISLTVPQNANHPWSGMGRTHTSPTLLLSLCLSVFLLGLVCSGRVEAEGTCDPITGVCQAPDLGGASANTGSDLFEGLQRTITDGSKSVIDTGKDLFDELTNADAEPTPLPEECNVTYQDAGAGCPGCRR